MAHAIYPHDLPTALDGFPDVRILSLDCFDTLLWRNTSGPKDAFADLTAGGVSVNQRVLAERRARVSARINEQRNEVRIEEIYAALMPNADEVARAAAIAREVEAEQRHCYPFAPTVQLMRAAKQRGHKVVIVSDTYLSQAQLTELLRTAAGEDVLALIDHIFCSSEYGKPKAAGLFPHVLEALGVPANRVLHIGDNRTADYKAPTALGIPALHLLQFDEGTRERLRLEVAGAAIFNTAVRDTLPAYQPHRPLLSIAQPILKDATTGLGYAALGPVFHGFARWLRAEAHALQAQNGGRVHLLFLMRDGHLPKLVFDALGDPELHSAAGEISRFTSSAATFADEDAVLSFARQAAAQKLGVPYVLSCLHFTADEAKRIAASLPAGAARHPAMVRHIGKRKTMRTIIERSDAFRARLLRHVRNQTGIQAGETLMLVDLGYNGTVQNNVSAVLEEGLGVHVAGRYMLLREAELTGLDKKGLVDIRSFDERALHALSLSVAVLEQLSTVDQGSVIDYAADGAPIRKANTISEEQSRIRNAVQDACVQFTRDYPAASHRRPASDDIGWDQGAAAALIRLLFLPTAQELEVLGRFQHDINLGTSALVDLFDADDAARELKRQGPFYLKNSRRMYLPGELREHGLALNLLAMTSWRLSLDLERRDFAGSGIALPVLVAQGADVSEDRVEALPTHDGYYVATIPVGRGEFAIGVQFPKLYDWLQIDSVAFLPSKVLLGGKASTLVQPIPAPYVLEGMEEAGPGLMNCVDPAGFMMVPQTSSSVPLVLEIVFRPLHQRAPVQVAAPAIVVEAKAA